MKRKKRTLNKFLKRMQKKLIVMFLLITLVLVALIGRLMYIEHTSGDKYEKIVLAQQIYDSRTIPYQRGDIVDTKGTVLATSVDVYNVIFDCKVLKEQEQADIDTTVSALAECFSELNEEDIYRILKDDPNSQYTVLLKKVPYEDLQPYNEKQEDLKKALEEYQKKHASGEKAPSQIVDGAVWFEKEYIRSYPYNALASSVIGFVSDGNVGTTGLENYYNSTLNGLDGREYGYLNADNNFEKTVRRAKDGNTIVSTIDANIQKVVEEKLAKYNETNANGFRQGDGSRHIAALLMNPQNGEVLAMAKYPTFDLNNPRDLSSYYTEEELAGMSGEEKLDKLNELWENFCVTYTYEPGSTVKPMTVACGLDTGTLRGNEGYLCDGVEDFNGQEVHCVSRVGHGMETIEQALMDSCNDALMQMSYVIGKENFQNYLGIFGFGKKTGIDLPGEEKGLLIQDMKLIDLATNSFGQNFNCTMIQLASAFSSLINGGQYYQPHLVKKILDADGNTIETINPVLLKETTSKETSEMIKSYLYKTVSEGTGMEAKVDGYSMGGKTGTAQKHPRSEGMYLVSFVGYLPQENPQLVIYLIIDEPNVAEQAHSNYAQGVVKEILEEILPYMNIYPDEEKTQTPEDEEGTGEGQEPEGGEGTGEGQEPEGGEGQGPEGGENPGGGQEPEGGENPGEGQEPEGGEGAEGGEDTGDEQAPQDPFSE